MSTQRLINPPSYDSLPRPNQSRYTYRYENSAAAVIQPLSFLIFTSASILSTAWAYQNTKAANLNPPESVPWLPYFASLCLLTSLIWWVGYLFFIKYDAAVVPAIRQNIVIWASVLGKFVLASAHYCLCIWYKYSFPTLVQPNWWLAFLSAQAWLDFALFVVYSALRDARR